MKLDNLFKLAEYFENKLQGLDPSIVLEEHDDTDHVSYMAYNNLKNIINDASELLSLLNDKDDLPQWANEALALAKANVNKALSYVRSEKLVINSSDLTKIAQGKYDHIDFKPPQSVADAASRGLELRKKNKGKGGLSTQQAKKEGVGSGVARAVSLKNRKNLSPSTVRRMKAFFDRHEQSKKIDKGKTYSTDKGYIAWCLRGDSMVLLEDGTSMSIKDLVDNKIDKKVVSYNEITKKFESKRIIGWSKTPSSINEFYILGKDKTDRLGISKKTFLAATAEHPFYVEGKWIKAADMDNQKLSLVDYAIEDYSPSNRYIIYNQKVSKFGKADIFYNSYAATKQYKWKYNLEIEDNHNFIANGILVHNCLWGGDPGKSWANKIVKQMDAADKK
jgi:hypothetical protein